MFGGVADARKSLEAVARERPDHTLQASALVNEAYLKLVDVRQMKWQNRAPFSVCLLK